MVRRFVVLGAVAASVALVQLPACGGDGGSSSGICADCSQVQTMTCAGSGGAASYYVTQDCRFVHNTPSAKKLDIDCAATRVCTDNCYDFAPAANGISFEVSGKGKATCVANHPCAICGFYALDCAGTPFLLVSGDPETGSCRYEAGAGKKLDIDCNAKRVCTDACYDNVSIFPSSLTLDIPGKGKASCAP